ncbi:MAG TPA: YqiA/YcfP family alpha/beta fold hydrolase [Bryobacteraceae bacterium]|nr:YqiA/YcfP family alpha/beta fold hydrolase [Bryobacteraceae bacterium]
MRYIYLHGFASGPQSSKALYMQKRFAEAGLELTIPDLNVPTFETMTISAQLDLVAELAQSECCLLGSSMGGYLAALYASRSDNVRSLVLLAPAFEFFERWPLLIGSEAFATWRRTGYREVLHYGEQELRRIGWQLVEDAQSYPGAPDFRQPALIFHGLRDDTVPVQSSRFFADGRLNIQLEVLDSDHQMTDVVETIWQGTRAFLRI